MALKWNMVIADKEIVRHNGSLKVLLNLDDNFTARSRYLNNDNDNDNDTITITSESPIKLVKINEVDCIQYSADNFMILLIPVFFNLFWFTAPFKAEKKIWRHPYLDKMTIWGTLSSNRTKKGSKFNIWRHPWHLFTAPLCAAAPRLRTTGLDIRRDWFQSKLRAY